MHPALVGAWDSNLTPEWVGADVVTRKLQLICAADGSGAVRFILDDQSLGSQGGTGCERQDYWQWNRGTCTVSGQTLQFNVSGTYSLTFPNGWISGDCNPSLNSTNPISDSIEFTFWQVVGTTLNVTVPAG
jgi:hypothetical protein